MAAQCGVATSSDKKGRSFRNSGHAHMSGAHVLARPSVASNKPCMGAIAT